MTANRTAWRDGEVRAPYKKRRADAKPHTWRTRPDPFGEVWPLLHQWLNEEPHMTAKGVFRRLDSEMPSRFGLGQYRTLQRRVNDWRIAIARQLVLSGISSETLKEMKADGSLMPYITS